MIIKDDRCRVKPRGGYKKVKVHAIEFKGISKSRAPYAVTFCSNSAVDWDKTDEKVSCAVCLRLMKRGRSR